MKKLFDKNYYNYCAKLLLVVKFYRNNLNILKRAVAAVRSHRRNLVYDVQSVDCLSEHGIVPVKLGAVHRILHDIELGA